MSGDSPSSPSRRAILKTAPTAAHLLRERFVVLRDAPEDRLELARDFEPCFDFPRFRS